MNSKLPNIFLLTFVSINVGSENMSSSSSCSLLSLSTASPWPPSAGNRRPRRSSFNVCSHQSYRSDEGRRRHIVDANMKVLRERIEEVRVKERLERCLESEFGWNYDITFNNGNKVRKNNGEVDISSVLLWFVCNVGFTILGCSFFLCLTSILIHHFPH